MFLIDRKAEMKKNLQLHSVKSHQEGINEQYVPRDYSKIKIGTKTLQDAIISYGDYKKVNSQFGDKTFVLRAIANMDLQTLREVSQYYFRASGIYARLCKYMAYMFKYDWFVTPYIEGCQGLLEPYSGITDVNGAGGGESIDPEKDQKELKTKKKAFNNFFAVLHFFENLSIKHLFGQIALKVIKYGVYYGYIIAKNNSIALQQLPPKYCRSRFKVGNIPAVEFNMKFFDDKYPDTVFRQKVLALYPEDFQKGYKLYKQQKLPPSFKGDSAGWYLLNPKSVVKFNMNDDDTPPFISVVPYILDLDAAQDLDRKKMAQKLLKIIIQSLPLDKNGDPIFDMDEAQALHNNAVGMLEKAIGIDVLTTFAEVEVADMSDRGNQSNIDELEKVQRTVYNEAGVSQLQFNSDGNTALNNSILNDQASMQHLLVQFEAFMNLILEPFNKSPKKYYYKAQLLRTTIYNYKQMAKLYKEQASIGYSKMLPQVALGQTQSSILANAYFENDILDLVRVFIPPLMSSTMNAEAINSRDAASRNPNKSNGNGEGAGRPQKQDNQKSDKTIRNLESQ